MQISGTMDLEGFQDKTFFFFRFSPNRIKKLKSCCTATWRNMVMGPGL